ncbi:uncharacterized protein LOC130802996 [Amaranthus tricolor]|uniref:uncharacterized protein LOC130802996 n=1 Tax=Amaranthus tricolor TaxID=29722 RepID=UPI00259085DA|nr:uncharacterized protein LOC130802996 [Amaranthus tricolor]XP_057523130.1 uncharacterized protein LOC130802996 [Amaranthus tricolor]
MMIRMCSSTSTSTDHLRSQLDQLHSEVHITRTKANNARLRLLRLSEAAENLCRQAAVSVRKDKEDEARELLLQKKKVMLALEKSKGRVELLDELAAKLTEAISIKEAQLVRNVALDLEIDGDNAEGPVRIVSPTRDDEKTLDDDYNITYQSSDGDDKKLGPATNKEGNVLSFKEEVHAVSENISNGNEGTMFNNFKGLSTYIDFLDELDQQLYIIEKDLMTVFERPAAILENEEKLNSSKVKQLEILENIRGARMRIRDYVQEVSRSK